MKKLCALLMAVLLLIAPGCAAKEEAPAAAAPVTLADIQDASEVLRDVAVVTDLEEAESLSGNGQQVFLKLESMQPVKSFKLRGAYYMVSKLTPEQRAQGLCTCSAGNHAQGVGLATDHFDCAATVYVPSTAPETKLEKIRSYKNVTLEIVEGGFDDAKAACLADVEASGKIYIPPYDDKDVIAGQGTVGLEIMEQLPDADAVVVPVGGGGLCSGIAVAVKAINPGCRVYAVEPETAASMLESIKAGKPVELASADTIADGTAVKMPGDITYELCSTLCDGFITVTEEEIRAAIAQLYLGEGVTAEGAGALAAAAVMTGQIPADCKKVVCVVSGGNIDPVLLQEIVDEARGIRAVSTSDAPAAVGPYSQAIVAGDTVYLSGQIALDPATGEIAGQTVEEQTEQICRNIEAVLEAAGTDITRVVKTTCYLADINDFAAFNEVYARHFTSAPARSCVAVKDIPKGVLAEIDVIALK